MTPRPSHPRWSVPRRRASQWSPSTRTSCLRVGPCTLKVPGTPQIALAQLNMLGSQIGYSGSFAILSAAATDSNQVLWNNQLKQDLKTNPKFKNMKLVAIVNPPDDTAPSATTYTENILKAYPTIKGIIAPTTVAIAAAAQVIQQQHLCSKYVVTGLGDPQQMKTFVTSGCVKHVRSLEFHDGGPGRDVCDARRSDQEGHREVRSVVYLPRGGYVEDRRGQYGHRWTGRDLHQQESLCVYVLSDRSGARRHVRLAPDPAGLRQ